MRARGPRTGLERNKSSGKIVLYPPPAFHLANDYAGGPAYLRQIAGAPWAQDVYFLPDSCNAIAPWGYDLAVSEPGRRKPPCLCILKRLVAVVFPRSLRLLLAYFAELKRLSANMRRYRSAGSVIHVNGVGCEVVSIAAKLSGYRHVFGTVHNLPGDDQEAMHPLRRFVERMSFRCCDHVIFPSRYCKERWMERVRVSSSNTVIYHGCKAGSFSCALSQEEARQELGLQCDSTTLVLGVAGRLHECKGHKLLFDAISQIASTVPVLVLVAGHGPLRKVLGALATELGITERIMFLGQCDKMPVFYRSIDVNVLPSLSEGLGYSVIEAMHSGLPQLVSDAGGMAELVRESGSGIVFPSGDSEALANAIVNMYRQREHQTLDGYGQKAREYAERELTEKRMLARTLAFYESC